VRKINYLVTNFRKPVLRGVDLSQGVMGVHQDHDSDIHSLAGTQQGTVVPMMILVPLS
jgi:hypothetical protein